MRGARWVQESVLEAMPDANVRVYAIFFEIVAGDEGAKLTVEPREILDDPRVTLYWDDRRVTGRWFDEHVTRIGKRSGEADRVEWDAFILYSGTSEWGERSPVATGWGRPIFQERARLLRGVEGALRRLSE